MIFNYYPQYASIWTPVPIRNFDTNYDSTNQYFNRKLSEALKQFPSKNRYSVIESNILFESREDAIMFMLKWKP